VATAVRIQNVALCSIEVEGLIIAQRQGKGFGREGRKRSSREQIHHRDTEDTEKKISVLSVSLW
jgi:biotin-(acetyl-CoA carboxylase) ligase